MSACTIYWKQTSKKIHSIFEDRSTYLDITFQEDYAINFFPQKDLLLQQDTNDQVHQIAHIIGLACKTESPFSPSEIHIIESAIHSLYDKLSDKDTPILEDYQAALSSLPPRDSLDSEFIQLVTKNLDLFTSPKSPRSVLFNRKSALSLDTPQVIFDITHLDKDPLIQSIYLYLINTFLIHRMIHEPSKRQAIFYDEAWKLLTIPGATQLIEGLYRTGRKYGTSITCISQFVKDFIGDEKTPIRDGSYIKYIFQVNDSNLLASDAFGFNSSQINAVNQLDNLDGSHRQCFIQWGPHSTVAHLAPSKFEMELFSTDFSSLNLYKNLTCSDEIFTKMKEVAYATN